MAPLNLLILIPLLTIIFTRTLSRGIIPLTCTEKIMTCNSSLYHISKGFAPQQIASYYSVNTSQLAPIYHSGRKDYLVSVPCGCKNLNGTVGYFYETSYTVQPNDTFHDVSTKIYSGQVWKVGEPELIAGEVVSFHLACGCVEEDSQVEVVVTYTVQDHDTLPGIATLLTAKLEGIKKMNPKQTKNPSHIDVGWVLLVPKEKNGLRVPKGHRHKKWPIIIGVLSAVTLISTGTLFIILLRRKRVDQMSKEDTKVVS